MQCTSCISNVPPEAQPQLVWHHLVCPGVWDPSGDRSLQ